VGQYHGRRKGQGLDKVIVRDARQILVFILNPDPYVTGQDRSVGADCDFLIPGFFILQHAWVNQTEIGDASVFFAIVIHGFLNLDIQCSLSIIEP
jgi:hypothetical protein